MDIEFEFERGGVLRVKLNAQTAQTNECLRRALPIKSQVLQARWSGRELAVPVNLPQKPPREHQSIRANIGDVIYFTEWGDRYDYTGFENIGLFYGAEIVREWRGDAAVNVFGKIDPSQHSLIEEIGDRVWRRGAEGILIRVAA